jgi:uncharacterized protein YlxP (DUF503 family)
MTPKRRNPKNSIRQAMVTILKARSLKKQKVVVRKIVATLHQAYRVSEARMMA